MRILDNPHPRFEAIESPTTNTVHSLTDVTGAELIRVNPHESEKLLGSDLVGGVGIAEILAVGVGIVMIGPAGALAEEKVRRIPVALKSARNASKVSRTLVVPIIVQDFNCQKRNQPLIGRFEFCLHCWSLKLQLFCHRT